MGTGAEPLGKADAAPSPTAVPGPPVPPGPPGPAAAGSPAPRSACVRPSVQGPPPSLPTENPSQEAPQGQCPSAAAKPLQRLCSFPVTNRLT